MPKATDRYSFPARTLHWLMASGFALMWVCGFAMTRLVADGSRIEELLHSGHISVGVSLGGLLLLRAAVRFRTPPPPFDETLYPWEKVSARFAHLALYGLPVAIVVAGWAATDLGGHGVHWFEIPLPKLLPTAEGTDALALTAHAWLAYAMLAVAVVHSGAAFRHGRRTLRRMW